MEILCSYIKSWEDNKMNEIQDERYHIADEAIYDAFFLILKEKELDKITVSDVIKKAGIVRSTFYNHYENIPDLVDAIENKTINDICNSSSRIFYALFNLYKLQVHTWYSYTCRQNT